MQFDQLKRREFITLLGGAATWPLAAHAQRPGAVRHIGVLMPLPVDDPVGRARIAAFREALQQRGWTEGRNIRIEHRWAVDGANQFDGHASELVALAPEVIMVTGSAPAAALQRTTRSLPIVFVQVADPVGAGFVQSLARPGGNATGFTPFEYGTSAKWLELLKEIAPSIRRVAVLREATNPGGLGQTAAIQSAAPSLGVEVAAFDSRDATEIERSIVSFAAGSGGGLILTATPSANTHRELIIRLAAQHRLPAVYAMRFHVTRGGLIAYGPDQIDPYRRAAVYIDRILKGEKPADLPVQAPTKYELVINLKTAKALGLEVPASVLARADEVIE